MKKMIISTASLVEKLRLIWSEDVHELDKMLQAREDGTDLYVFINSIRQAKQQLLSMLPYTNASLQEVPTTPTTGRLLVVKSSLQTQDIDRVKLPKILLQIEGDQFQYLRHRVNAPGIPSGVKETLKGILSVYQSIIAQLRRANKTQQLQPIVLL